MKATSGDLARLGFVDATAALAHLTSLGESADPLVALLGRTADPDQALAELLRLLDAVHDRDGAEGRGELLDALVHDEGTAMRLLCVLGASEALAHHLTRHPE